MTTSSQKDRDCSAMFGVRLLDADASDSRPLVVRS